MNKQFLDTFQVPLPFLFTYDMFDIKWSQGDTEKKKGSRACCCHFPSLRSAEELKIGRNSVNLKTKC